MSNRSNVVRLVSTQGMSREQWLAVRRGRIGSSDAAVAPPFYFTLTEPLTPSFRAVDCELLSSLLFSATALIELVIAIS